MASLTVRQLDDKLKKQLRLRAAKHGRSVEDEVRTILRSAAADDDAFVPPQSEASPARVTTSDARHIEALIVRTPKARLAEALDQKRYRVPRRTLSARTDHQRGSRQHQIRCVAGLARRLSREQFARAPQVDVRVDRKRHKLLVIFAAELVQQRETRIGLHRVL